MSRTTHFVNTLTLAACVALALVCLDRGGDVLAWGGWCVAAVFHVVHWVGDTFKASREA